MTSVTGTLTARVVLLGVMSTGRTSTVLPVATLLTNRGGEWVFAATAKDKRSLYAAFPPYEP